jgi:sulfate adenylyltransferase
MNPALFQRNLEEDSDRTFELYMSEDVCNNYKNKTPFMDSWQLNQRQLCDLELIMNGGFFPLTGFMDQNNYKSVITKMRLDSGELWPIPVTLEVPKDFAERLQIKQEIILRNPEGVGLAILKISDIYIPYRDEEAQLVYGTTDRKHPGISYLFNHTDQICIGGEILGLQKPTHYDFSYLRLSPAELKNLFSSLGWNRIVGFQTRNPMHRAHKELTIRAAKEYEAGLLLHPSVGMTKPGDIDHYTRVRCYEKLLARYEQLSAILSLLPLAMRMAGPREALWHAIIRKNYGCTHFIVGRDHAGPGKDSYGKDFYAPYEAQDLTEKYQKELGIQIVPFQEMVYSKSKKEYFPINLVKEKDDIMSISGTELRKHLIDGTEIPEWFSFPEIINELRKTYPAKNAQGLTIFFTGLSGAGKSTIANALLIKLMEIGGRSITLLDGDIVRQNLSSELGFSKEDRNLNILRIGYVASEITKHGGIAICAPIAPYLETRNKVREMVSITGGFIEIYVNTPLTLCESRDRKGLYAKARAGLIKNFTGINDPYEAPNNSEIVLNTENTSIKDNVNIIINYLEKVGFITEGV